MYGYGYESFPGLPGAPLGASPRALKPRLRYKLNHGVVQDCGAPCRSSMMRPDGPHRLDHGAWYVWVHWTRVAVCVATSTVCACRSVHRPQAQCCAINDRFNQPSLASARSLWSHLLYSRTYPRVGAGHRVVGIQNTASDSLARLTQPTADRRLAAQKSSRSNRITNTILFHARYMRELFTCTAGVRLRLTSGRRVPRGVD